jgi:hypothetical protein
MGQSASQSSRRLAAIAAVVALNVAGVCYYAYFLSDNGYLPSPFIFDKSDTFMDLFHPMYWAYDDGRYTEWGSVYPPLSFLVLRFANFVFAGAGQGDSFLMRDNSPMVIAGFCLTYLLLPIVLLATRHWQRFSTYERILLYLVLIFSTPMLFALERGNMIILCPILLALALSRIGLARGLYVALLINIKPYFGLLMIYYIARRNWRGLAVCSALSALIFLISGLLLDSNFLVFFLNLLNFSQEEALFSPREVMAMPSSVSAFSYVLKHPEGALYAAQYLGQENIPLIAYLLEATKWGALSLSLMVLVARSSKMRDAEMISLLVVILANLGVWVGGYTLILYIALIPTLIKMRAGWLYVSLLATIAMPLDFVSFLDQSIGTQYSFLLNAYVDVQWSLGAGSVIRPLINFLLLCIFCYELWARDGKLVHQTLMISSNSRAIARG